MPMDSFGVIGAIDLVLTAADGVGLQRQLLKTAVEVELAQTFEISDTQEPAPRFGAQAASVFIRMNRQTTFIEMTDGTP